MEVYKENIIDIKITIYNIMLKIGIIGSGISSFFLASSILKRIKNVQISIFEKESYPFGLLQKGISPLSVEFKLLIDKFNKILTDPRISLFTSTEIDQDIIPKLDQGFHLLIDATGSIGAKLHPSLSECIIIRI